ncbi:MAG: (deoxy)nucleoside triphosphate pyrophosphohydrolase [Alphaproteobacteria bacterium]|nr:(deoxy)nucleoside triphosphate pyrophosphohydrolase [Alphaproteobacteria bacterium]
MAPTEAERSLKPLQTSASVGIRVVTVVAAALVRSDLRLLLSQRPEGKPMAGLWELPGGKLEVGETPRTGLIRELREELAIEVDPADLSPFAFASHDYPSFHLLMPVFLCRKWSGEVRGAEGQAFRWVAPEELADYPTPEADIPLIARYLEWSRP